MLRRCGTGLIWPASTLFAAASAARAGLPPHRVGDLIIAVGELIANTLAHTNEPGQLTLWTTGSEVICQVHDIGEITDPLAGRPRPDPGGPGGGRGLWVVHQLCDLVEIRTGPAGTTTRVHLQLRAPLARCAETPAAPGPGVVRRSQAAYGSWPRLLLVATVGS